MRSFGAKSICFSSVCQDIDKAFAIRGCSAVVLIVDSPGGSPVQSELIASRIIYLSKTTKIPVIAFAENIAASGGFWLLCAASEIYASQSSLIGSIGVVSAGFWLR